MYLDLLRTELNTSSGEVLATYQGFVQQALITATKPPVKPFTIFQRTGIVTVGMFIYIFV